MIARSPRRVPAAFLMAVLCLFVAGSAVAQSTIHEITDKAQQLVAAQEWNRAQRLLRDADDACDDSACRARLEFTRGYLYQRWAAADAVRRESLLERSAHHYLRARELAPLSEPIWLNECVVRKDLGEWDYLDRAFGYAAETWPAKRVAHLVIYGDFHAEAGHLERARRLYGEALALDPENEDALRALLGVQRRDLSVTAGEMFAQAGDLAERQLWGAAAASLEVAIPRSLANDQPRADQALVRWVDARLAHDNLSAGALAAMPVTTAWPSPALGELARVLEDPVAGAADLHWWRDGLLRRDVMARVLLLQGRRLRNTGQVADAAAVLEQARAVAPPFDVYREDLLLGRSLVALDASLELCVIYSNQEENQRRFQDLERELFDEKRRAYLGEDLAAIQRYHTVLGLVYVDRRRFSSDWADNAVFQLEHALRTSRQREEQEVDYLQPLPELRVLLAESYLRRAEETGGDQAGARAQAARSYKDAARDHLDLDRLDVAAEMLTRCRQTDAGTAEQYADEIAGIARIVDSRRGLAGAATTPWQTGADGRPVLAASDSWILAGEFPGLDPDFVQRQRFKVLGDLGHVAAQEGDVTAERFFNGSAVSALPPTKGLASRHDVERLDRINRSVTRDVSFIDRDDLVKRPRGQVDAAVTDAARVYYVQTPRGPQPVVVASDLLLAGEVLREVRLVDDEAGRQTQLTIEAGRVEINPRVLQEARPETIEEARKTIDRIESTQRRK